MALDLSDRIVILETHSDHSRREMVDLRADMKAIRNDVVDVKVGLGRLTERVDHLPTKAFIITASMSTMVFLAAFIAFQDHIRAFFAH